MWLLGKLRRYFATFLGLAIEFSVQEWKEKYFILFCG